jgi:hypothetical protein
MIATQQADCNIAPSKLGVRHDHPDTSSIYLLNIKNFYRHLMFNEKTHAFMFGVPSCTFYDDIRTVFGMLS